jgi:hypothetical protein
MYRENLMAAFSDPERDNGPLRVLLTTPRI